MNSSRDDKSNEGKLTSGKSGEDGSSSGSQPEHLSGDPVVLELVTKKDRRLWTSLYGKESRRRQLLEGWLLFLAIIAVLIAIGLTWHKYQGTVHCLGVMALLGGLLGGLLQDAKFFYKSVGDGNWIWNKGWWRLLTPLLSGAMGFSVYAIFIGFGESQSPSADKGQYYAYGIGFLTGLFADNAIQKLRDIAYAVFGTPKDPPHKLHAPKKGSTTDRQVKTNGSIVVTEHREEEQGNDEV